MTIIDAIESVFEKNGIDLNPREVMAALKRAGYAIVPRIATEGMLTSAQETKGAPKKLWTAMVAAAESGI